MELKKQVVSLDLAKRLKELNCPQESLWYWIPYRERGEYIIDQKSKGGTMVLWKKRNKEGNKMKCRKCGAEIVFIKTVPGGKLMPCDVKIEKIMTKEGRLAVGHKSHFATCPYADDFRDETMAEEIPKVE